MASQARSAAPLLCLIGIGILLAKKEKKKQRGISYGNLEAKALPESSESEDPVGIYINDSGIYISDWGKWMNFAPKAIRQAVAMGANSAQDILMHMMCRIFPDVAWPPPRNSLMFHDWQAMLMTIESCINQPDPTMNANLRLVR